jgi:hypothetical protein
LQLLLLRPNPGDAPSAECRGTQQRIAIDLTLRELLADILNLTADVVQSPAAFRVSRTDERFPAGSNNSMVADGRNCVSE